MFNFNAYSSPLLIGFVQGVVYAALLVGRGRRDGRLYDYFAAGILLAGALYVAQWMLGFAGWYDERDWRTTIMMYVEWSHLTVLGPLIWLYFRSVTNTDFRWRRSYWMHFLPWAIFLLPAVGVFLYDWLLWRGVLGEAFTHFGNSRGPASEWKNAFIPPVDMLEEFVVKLQLAIYLVMTVRAHQRYRNYLREEFSNPSALELRGLRSLLYILLIGLVLTTLLEIGYLVTGADSYTEVWSRYLSMSVLVFFAAIQFYAIDPRLVRQLRFKDEGALPPESVRIPADDPEEATEIDRWAGLLEARIARSADHLDPGLRLGDLATHLGTNASVLSRTINRRYGVNFNDYINGLRCEAFLDRLRAGDHLRHTLLSLALDCGFNSKSTFNRAFRKHHGKSPVEAVREVDANHDLTRPKP